MIEYQKRGYKGLIQKQGNTITIGTFTGKHLIVSGDSGRVIINRFACGILTVRGNIHVDVTYMNQGLIDLGDNSMLRVIHFDKGRIVALENNSMEIANFTFGEIDAGNNNTINIANRGKKTGILLGDQCDCIIRRGKQGVKRNKSKGMFEEIEKAMKDIEEGSA